MIQLLIANNADLNTRSRLATQTPLAVAALDQNYPATKCLLEKGADPFFENAPSDQQRINKIMEGPYPYSTGLLIKSAREKKRAKVIRALNNPEISPLPKDLAQLTTEFTY